MDRIKEEYETYKNPSNVILEEENFLDYRPGGFHPVALGDALKAGRYQIHHKLGYGGFSTVWVARDCSLEQWVSLKITKADRANQSRELPSLRALAQHSNQNPAFGHIVQLLDDFVHEGPNGSHQCLVFELLGPTVDSVVNDAYHFGERLDKTTIIRISTQLLKAVAFMHEAGYAHGDLSTKNLAFYNARLSRLSREKLFDALGSPDAEELTRLDGKPLGRGIPKQLVESTQWPGWPLDEEDEDEYDDDDNIRVIDFGEAFTQDTAPDKLAQPGSLQAPETIFTGKCDYRQDLWRVGLVIYNLVFGVLPYSWWGINPLVESMIDVFGDLPPVWQPKWEQMRSEATARGDPGAGDWKQVLDQRLEQHFDTAVNEQQLKGLLPVIQGLTRLLPSDRISASEALELIEDNCGSSNRSEDSENNPSG